MLILSAPCIFKSYTRGRTVIDTLWFRVAEVELWYE